MAHSYSLIDELHLLHGKHVTDTFTWHDSFSMNMRLGAAQGFQQFGLCVYPSDVFELERSHTFLPSIQAQIQWLGLVLNQTVEVYRFTPLPEVCVINKRSRRSQNPLYIAVANMFPENQEPIPCEGSASETDTNEDTNAESESDTDAEANTETDTDIDTEAETDADRTNRETKSATEAGTDITNTRDITGTIQLNLIEANGRINTDHCVADYGGELTQSITLSPIACAWQDTVRQLDSIVSE